MPNYLFENPKTQEIKEIFFHMNDDKKYQENGVEWRRKYCAPQARIDGEIDPFNSQQFIDKTYNKKGTYGDLLDRSAELSAKRADIAGGSDPVKQQYFDNYSKTRKGAKHPDQFKKKFENKHVSVDFTAKD